MKTYEFKVLDKDQYLVIKVNDKFPKGDKRRYQEYHVDLRDGDTMCSCKGFYFTKKSCRHIKFILAQLTDGGGILDFQQKPHKENKRYKPPKKRKIKLNKIEIMEQDLLD